MTHRAITFRADKMFALAGDTKKNRRQLLLVTSQQPALRVRIVRWFDKTRENLGRDWFKAVLKRKKGASFGAQLDSNSPP
jgi:hypothetical protein